MRPPPDGYATELSRETGLLESEVTAVAATVAAGAEGYSLAGAVVNGVDLQLYGTSAPGALFQTCASGSGDSSAPTVVTCGATPFAGLSRAALRVKPKGYSNMREVGIVVTRATLEVRYR